MADDERLREALLELQMLRDREARTLRETRDLLECIESYSVAESPGKALTSVFTSLSSKIGSAASVIVETDGSGDAEVVASDTRELLGKRIRGPVDLFSRARNITDKDLVGSWQLPPEISDMCGLIIAPMSNAMAFLTFRERPTAFVKHDLSLVQRLAGLAAQAVKNRQISAENNLLAATISGSSSGIAISDATDPEHPLIYVNEAFETLSGYRADEVIGRNCRILNAEPIDSAERRRLRDAVRTNSAGTFLVRNKRKTGELFWNELTLYPVHDDEGQTRNLVATQTDVTPRVEASEARDRVQKRMNKALTSTVDAFLVLEADGRIGFANEAVSSLFPLSNGSWTQGLAFDDVWKAYLSDAQDLPGRITSLLRTPDLSGLANVQGGREIDLPDGRTVLLRSTRLDDGGLVVSATDVTAMKSAKDLLSQRLAAIEATRDGIIVTDAGDRMVYLNPAAEHLLGFEKFRGLGQTWTSRYELAPSEATTQAFEIELQRVDGDKTHEIFGSPLNTGGSVIVIRDITERLANEAREDEMMRDLMRLQRQEAVSQLTAGVAHDFNNLLSAINGSATLISMFADLPAQVGPHVRRISKAGSEAAKLINRLLDVGTGEDVSSVFDLRSVLKGLPSLVGPSLPDNIKLSISAEATNLALRGSSGMLSQILINLVLNARDAIPGPDGKIAITVERVNLIDNSELAIGSLENGRTYARIMVSDNGDGMVPEIAEKIFQPYFTTKGRQGSGLGLAIAAMQVQNLGGAIGLESTFGKGTTMSLFWPTSGEWGEIEKNHDRGHIDLTGKLVIVVDDDAEVADVISNYLQANGADVAVCLDPRDAISALEEDPDDWSALITDYDMPIMNGGELAQKASEVAPDVPVIVVTALARRLNDPRLGNGGAAAILAKPVDLDRLCSTISEVSSK